MTGYVRFITAAKTSWIVLVLAAAAAAALFAFGSGGESDNAPAVGLPDSAESVQVEPGSFFGLQVWLAASQNDSVSHSGLLLQLEAQLGACWFAPPAQRTLG